MNSFLNESCHPMNFRKQPFSADEEMDYSINNDIQHRMGEGCLLRDCPSIGQMARKKFQALEDIEVYNE